MHPSTAAVHLQRHHLHPILNCSKTAVLAPASPLLSWRLPAETKVQCGHITKGSTSSPETAGGGAGRKEKQNSSDVSGRERDATGGEGVKPQPRCPRPLL